MERGDEAADNWFLVNSRELFLSLIDAILTPRYLTSI